MIQVYWLEQAEADIPVENGWLAAGESARLESFRFPKRRTDWLLGRWTAKNAVAIHLNLPLETESLANIEIRQSPSGAPEVLIANQTAPVVISLSHRAGRSICAVAPSGEAMGCDLELVEPRSDAFIADYFVPEEQAWVASASKTDRPWVLALLWSAKESALKALGTGLRLDTRCVSVSPTEPAPHQTNQSPARGGEWLTGDEHSRVRGSWRPLWVRHQAGQVFHGWWSRGGRFLRTAVTLSPSPEPILLATQGQPAN
jgi:4'-phosphopantetheinyl transferase